jgi:hypothetical protein
MLGPHIQHQINNIAIHAHGEGQSVGTAINCEMQSECVRVDDDATGKHPV